MLLYLEPPFPIMAVFTLDYVLWPYYTNSTVDVVPPLSKNSSGVYDSSGKRLTFYCEVVEIFKLFREKNISMSVINYSKEENPAIELLKLFDWEQYFHIADVSANDARLHLTRVKMMSDASYNYTNMIFFDPTPANVEQAADLGVNGYLITNGIMWRDAIICLKQYQSKYKNATETINKQSGAKLNENA